MDRLKEQFKELIFKLIDDCNNNNYSWYIEHFNNKKPKYNQRKLTIQLIDDFRSNNYSFIIKYNKMIRKEKLNKIKIK